MLGNYRVRETKADQVAGHQIMKQHTKVGVVITSLYFEIILVWGGREVIQKKVRIKEDHLVKYCNRLEDIMLI